MGARPKGPTPRPVKRRAVIGGWRGRAIPKSFRTYMKILIDV